MSTTIQGTGASSAAASAAVGATTASGDIQDRFLKLLVAQMKNQDPLNPMDNSQVTSQLAQLSTVDGIQKLNTSMQGLAASVLSTQSVQSAGLIGRTVVTDGSSLSYTSGSSVSGGIQLASAADSVKINIVGPAGNVVRQLDLGARDGGLVSFQWNGRTDGGASSASGAYTFEVNAASAGKKVDAAPVASGAVTSVTLGSDGVHLYVNGIGDVKMQNIKSIL